MKYSLSFRIWHWLNATVVFGLLATVFLRKTFLSWRENSEILMMQLSQMSIEITAEQAKVLAKAVRAGMWEWHIILGYALVLLVFFRIYLFFKDASVKENFNTLSLHKKGVQSLYYLFYGTLLFMSISGLLIHFHQELQISKALAEEIKELHEFVFNAIMIFVPLHIAGVIIAESKEEKGLVSSMINGKTKENF
ncbi:cytochrome b/b6 domain-containing protein [bacterium]|nr:cytochrome b/b6 domain-containing protein [bacterium]MBU1994891.1 cytochrome b/b6 domain-containing protein [bacterium]